MLTMIAVVVVVVVVVLSLCTPSPVAAKDVFYDFHLHTEIDPELSPDCMNVKDERRSLFLANGAFPGPLIEAEEGDNVTVRVYNGNEASSVSIHYHGIHQAGTPYSDGSSWVTQCALGPLQVQEYNFIAYPPGTHYWHDHAAYHMVDGLAGPLIVRPKDTEPFAYDEERILFLQDWYIETGTQQLDGLSSYPFVWVGNPNSLLINGKGIAPECQPGGASFNDTLICLDSCQDDPLALLSTINVTEGKTYRLRIINSGQLVLLNLAIARHTMTIVQVEGTNVEPINVTSLDIGPGQRYDVLLTTDQTPGSYLIETIVRERPIFDIKGTAILHYDSAPVTGTLPTEAPIHPLHNATEFGVAQDVSLQTIDVTQHSQSIALSSTNVRRYVLVGTQNEYMVNGVPELLRWAVNNISNTHGDTTTIGKATATVRLLGWPASIQDTMDIPVDPPFVWNYSSPVLDAGGPGKPLGFLSEAVIGMQEGEVIEFVLQNARAINGAAEYHPWHSHGHSFWVVGQGPGTFDPARDVANYNLANPILRDTVSLQPSSWVAVRFVADNPGAWLFHCHILSHHVMGMGFVMVVEPDKIEAESVVSRAQYCSGSGSGQMEDATPDSDDGGGSTSGVTIETVWRLGYSIGMLLLALGAVAY